MSSGQSPPSKRAKVGDGDGENLTAIRGAPIGSVIDEEAHPVVQNDQDPSVDSSSSPQSQMVDHHYSILNVSQLSEQVGFKPTGFLYILDAPTSASIRLGDDPLSFLNKDQVRVKPLGVLMCSYFM